MAQIDNKFKVKRGLEVAGDAVLLNNLTVVGDVNVPTLPQTDDSTKAATTAFVKQAVANIVESAPGTLDTLNELAAALGDDANFATTTTNNLALKAPLESPALTGIPTAPTAAPEDDTNQLATTAFVQSQKESPVMSGTPTAPTAPVDTNTTQLATTAFVIGQAADTAPLMDSVATIGTSKRYARQDHIHASDTTKANLSGATFTGNVGFTNISTSGDISMFGYKVLQNSDQNLVFQTVAADKDIVFKTLGANERVRIKAGGNTLFGLTVDNGVDLVQVNGSVSATTFKGSAALTGIPTAPTANPGNKTTQIATTDFVTSADNLKANIASPAFTGSATFAEGIGSNDFKVLPMVGGGSFTTTAASVTGAFKIKLPVLYTSTMLQFAISVYEYSGKSFDLVVSGFNDSGTSNWSNASAYMIGGDNSKIPNVRFGNDGSTCCIWVGDVGTVWQYPQLHIKDVKIGYGGNVATWLSGWTVAAVTVLDTVKLGPIVPFKAANIASPTFTGVPRAPTAAAGNNSTQIATTAYVDAVDVLKAPLESPALTGTPTAPTAADTTNTTQIATTAFVKTAIANLVGSSPGTLDTLNELAAALGNDPNFATSMSDNLALKAPLASPALTGVPTAPTAAVDTDTTQVATTEFVVNQGYAKVADGYAKLASPVLTGVPEAPSAPATTKTTQIATTEFTHNAMNAILSKSVAGGVNVNLTAEEARNRVIYFTGALTANINVIFPTVAGMWTLVNKTTGAYTLTAKMAAGATVIISQNYSEIVISNAVDMIQAQSDFANVYLGGTPTATTAVTTENSTRIATTAFVKAQNYMSTSDTVDGGTF